MDKNIGQNSIFHQDKVNRQIVQFIIAKKAHDRIKAFSLFKEIEQQNFEPGQSAQSWKSRFSRSIIRKIRRYCDEKNAKIFERVWNHKKTTAKEHRNFLDSLYEEEDQIGEDLLPDQLKKNSQSQKKGTLRNYFQPRSHKNQHGVASQGSSHSDVASTSQETQGSTNIRASQQQHIRQTEVSTRRQASQQVQDTDVWMGRATSSKPGSPIRLVPFKIGAQKETLAALPFDIPVYDLNTEKFSKTEDREILNFLARKVSDATDLNKDDFWQEIRRWPMPLQGRSWDAIRQRFHELKRIKLNNLGVNFSVLAKLNLSANSPQKLSQRTFVKTQHSQPIRNTQAAAAKQFDVDKDSVLGALIEESSFIGQPQSPPRATRTEQPSTSRDDYRSFGPPPTFQANLQTKRTAPSKDPQPSTSRDNYQSFGPTPTYLANLQTKRTAPSKDPKPSTSRDNYQSFGPTPTYLANLQTNRTAPKDPQPSTSRDDHRSFGPPPTFQPTTQAKRTVTFDRSQPQFSRDDDSDIMPPPALQRNPQSKRTVPTNIPQPPNSEDDFLFFRKPCEIKKFSTSRSVTFGSRPPKTSKAFEKATNGPACPLNKQQNQVEKEKTNGEPVQTMWHANDGDVEDVESVLSGCSGITNNFEGLFRNTKTIEIAANAGFRDPHPEDLSQARVQQQSNNETSVTKQTSPRPTQTRALTRNANMCRVLGYDESDSSSESEHQTKRKKKHNKRTETENKNVQSNISAITSKESIIKSNLVTKNTQKSNNPQNVYLISDDEVTVEAPIYASDSSDDRRKETINETDDSDFEQLVEEKYIISDTDSEKEKQQTLSQKSNGTFLNSLEKVHAQSSSQNYTQDSEILVHMKNRLDVGSQDMETQMTVDSPSNNYIVEDEKSSGGDSQVVNELILEVNAQEDRPLSPLQPATPPVESTTSEASTTDQQPQRVYVLPQDIPANAQTNSVFPPNFSYPILQAGSSGVRQPQVIYMMPPAPPPPQKIYIIKSGKKKKVKKRVKTNTNWIVTDVSDSSDEDRPPEKKRLEGIKKKVEKKKGKPTKSENNDISKKQKAVSKKTTKKASKINNTSITSAVSVNKVVTRHQVAELSESQEQLLISEEEIVEILSEEEGNSLNARKILQSQNKSNASSSSGSKVSRKEKSSAVETSDGNRIRRSLRKRDKQDVNSKSLTSDEGETKQGRFVTTRARSTVFRRSPRISEGALELARLEMQGRM